MTGACVQVVVDERSHGTESLLHPLLAGVQGPALVIYLPGVVLSPDEVVGHMAPNRGAQPALAMAKRTCVPLFSPDGSCWPGWCVCVQS